MRYLPCVAVILLLTAGCSGGGSVTPTPISSMSSPTPTPSQTPGTTVEVPAQSDAVVDSIGANTHFDYSDTPYVTQFAAVSAALEASGIRHIRDGNAQSNFDLYGGRLTQLGMAGIKHSIEFNVGTTASEITSDLQQQMPYVDFVEPQDEYDAQASTNANWVSDLQATQQTIYQTVRSNAAFANVAILGPSFENLTSYAQFGDQDSFLDEAALLDTTCNFNPGAAVSFGIAADDAIIRQNSAKPIWTTETGYTDNQSIRCGIPDSIIARYDPRVTIDRFMAGQPRSYFYQFTDTPNDPQFGDFGLTDDIGNPKPQLTALSGMIALLSDPGTAFTPTSLPLAISGSTQNVEHLLLQKHDGTYVLLLWIEAPSWTTSSASGGSSITVAPQAITVTLGHVPGAPVLYTYNTSNWSIAQNSVSTAGNLVSLSVTDSISFLEFK